MKEEKKLFYLNGAKASSQHSLKGEIQKMSLHTEQSQMFSSSTDINFEWHFNFSIWLHRPDSTSDSESDIF